MRGFFNFMHGILHNSNIQIARLEKQTQVILKLLSFHIMSVHKIKIPEFLLLNGNLPVLDVRSSGEYNHAHIPGALSFPLFTDEERKEIGIAYKQVSKQTAIKIGLEAFGKNLVKMVEGAEKLIVSKANPSNKVIIHCWRGGMRSAAVAWLLDLYGFEVYLLEGGYKSYRRWALRQFEIQHPLNILGGYTGSNKTGIIELLKQKGEPAINLEEMAGHRGSAFGNLDRLPVPSQEHFENLLAFELHLCSVKHPGKKIWMEQESQRVGQINIPLPFFKYFIELPYYFIEVPFDERLNHIVHSYGKFSKESLINAIVRITKKLGGLEAKTAINFLLEEDMHSCFSVLLNYYDKLYHKNEAKRKSEKHITFINCRNTDAGLNLNKLFENARR